MKTQNTIPTPSRHIRKLPSFHGFTLIELIVVISILTILATISFFAIKDYYGTARDSARVTDIKTIQKGLKIAEVQMGSYYFPENAIQIESASTILSYQGYIGDSISRVIKTSKTPVDPKDATKYTYVVDKTQKKAQLMGYLESGDTFTTISYRDMLHDMINQSYAASINIDYKNRYIYVIGDKIGVLTDASKAPIQETLASMGVNLATTSTGYTAYFGGTTYGAGQSTGTGNILINQINGAITSTVPCNPTTYSGYTITSLAHLETKTFTKSLSITNGSGTGSLQIQCKNGTLDTLNAQNSSQISCNATFVNNGSNACVSDVCGSAPLYSISNGNQKYNTAWTHNIAGGGDCTFVCQAGYYWNTTACTPANIGYMVASNGATTQVACTANNTYQDIPAQSSCKTVSLGYYSTPNGAGAKTAQVQCEANNSCVSGVKTACTGGYTSSPGSTACTDQTAPTITSVTAAQAACNSIRFTINGATDVIGLHATPYSFDGGSTWQTGNTKDYASTNQTIAANQIKVRDTAGNIYTYGSSVNGTSASCAVNCSYTTYQGGSCSATCGGGNYATYYTKTVVESGGGTCAISEGQFAGYGGGSCNTQACPTSGPYSYGGWSGCSTTCGGGIQTRSQSCAYDSCHSAQTTSQSCNTQACVAYECGYNSCSTYWTTCAGACSTAANGTYSGCATCNGGGNAPACTPTGGTRSMCWASSSSCNVSDFVSPSEAAYWSVDYCNPNYSTTCAPNYACQQTSCTYISQTCYH